MDTQMEAVTGLPRSGKTLEVVRRLVRLYDRGWRSFAGNVELTDAFFERCPKAKYKRLNDEETRKFWMHGKKGTVFIIDEAGQVWSATAWSKELKENPEFSSYVMQSGKSGDIVLFISHAFEDLPFFVKRRVAHSTRCVAFRLPFAREDAKPLFFVTRRYYIRKAKEDEPVGFGTRIFPTWARRKYYGLYNSKSIVGQVTRPVDEEPAESSSEVASVPGAEPVVVVPIWRRKPVLALGGLLLVGGFGSAFLLGNSNKPEKEPKVDSSGAIGGDLRASSGPGRSVVRSNLQPFAVAAVVGRRALCNVGGFTRYLVVGDTVDGYTLLSLSPSGYGPDVVLVSFGGRVLPVPIDFGGSGAASRPDRGSARHGSSDRSRDGSARGGG